MPYKIMYTNPKDWIDGNAILKTIAIILFSFSSMALIMIAKNPCPEYEISVYNAVLPISWMLLLVAIMGGIGLMVHQAMVDEVVGIRYGWQIGLLLILFSNLVIILLPYIRGYAFPSVDDHLTHIGYVKDIMQTGAINSKNVYPATHLAISQLSFVTGISAETITNLFGPLFYIFFILFTFLLSREIIPKPATILATVASTILYCFYYIEVFPMGFAFIISILIFYLYFKYLENKTVGFAILILLLGILMAFFHPVASFSLIIAFLIMEFSKQLFDRLCINKSGQDRASRSLVSQMSFSFPFLFFIILMLWVWNHFQVWNRSISSVSGWFYNELLVEPMTQKAAESFGKLGLGFIGQGELFILMYGHYFIYMALSLIAVEEIAREFLHSPSKNTKSIYLLACFLLPAEAIWITDYFMPLTNLSSGRLICLVAALFPSFVGLALHKIGGANSEKSVKNVSKVNKGKLIKAVSVALIIILCSLIGIFSIYPSPFTLRTNPAASYAMVDGNKWLLEQSNSCVGEINLGTQVPFRYADALYGVGSNRPKVIVEENIADHFNYPRYATLGESFEGDRYVIVRSNFIKMIYTELYPQLHRFTKDDFSRLELDPSANFLYNNSDTQVWYVRGFT